MASNQSNWLWDDNVFGEQAPAHNPAPTPGVYPQCGRQQERNWALENLLYGMENVIAPDIAAIKAVLTTGVGTQGNISTVTDKLTLSAGADPLPTTKLNIFLGDLTAASCTGYLTKISIYNPNANNSVTINSNSTEGFLLESGVSLDLDRAGNTFFITDTDVTNTLATGTATQTIYIVYSVLVVNN
jgi:hypothetical protein